MSKRRHPCPCQNCWQWPPEEEKMEEELCWIVPADTTHLVKGLNWTVLFVWQPILLDTVIVIAFRERRRILCSLLNCWPDGNLFPVNKQRQKQDLLYTCSRKRNVKAASAVWQEPITSPFVFFTFQLYSATSCFHRYKIRRRCCLLCLLVTFFS